jgi:FAD/FMN-containing dehydrogenase
MVAVNDIHSELNETAVDEILAVESQGDVQRAVTRAAERGKAVAIAGGRHAMGGQQFCAGGVLLDTRGLDQLLDFDAEHGIVEVAAGIQWPELIAELAALQVDTPRRWGIAQKQTGADRLSLGGALAANVHGRGLTLKPIVSDVESFVLVGADGEARTCSRDDNSELFRLAIGGYGLFGCITSIRLRLIPRRTLERVVEVRRLDELMRLMDQRISDGFQYGDFQFAINPEADDFLTRGVFSCYRPVEGDREPPEGQKALSHDDWQRLLYLAHTDKQRAFDVYAEHYLATSGQLYYSDAHQFADYTDGYHHDLDVRLGATAPASEMITEIYVPRDRLVDLMEAVASDFRANGTEVIYGTIRLVEPDEETFLAWARERWACIIFNLHTAHTPEALERTADAFSLLIDRGIERGGSYYLTYHRWARREQVETCYPQFAEFLRKKLEHDPDERFQSEWYRHYRDMSLKCAWEDSNPRPAA